MLSNGNCCNPYTTKYYRLLNCTYLLPCLLMATAKINKKKPWKTGTSNEHITNLKQSSLETFNIYDLEQQLKILPTLPPSLSTSWTTWSHGSRLQSWLHLIKLLLAPTPLYSLAPTSLTVRRHIQSEKAKLLAWHLLTLPVKIIIHGSQKDEMYKMITRTDY